MDIEKPDPRESPAKSSEVWRRNSEPPRECNDLRDQLERDGVTVIRRRSRGVSVVAQVAGRRRTALAVVVARKSAIGFIELKNGSRIRHQSCFHSLDDCRRPRSRLSAAWSLWGIPTVKSRPMSNVQCLMSTA